MERIVNLGTIQHLERDTTPSSNNPASIDDADNDYSLIDYRLESARLASYENWPAPYVEPAILAAAGFFFNGDADRVKCFECGIEIFDWVEGDNPMSDHQRWRPICKFVRKLPCGNVPIGVDPDTIPVPTPKSRDIYGCYGEDYRLNALQDLRFGLSLTKSKNATHPEYVGYESRLRTFHNWPKSMSQTKEQLADAGFYHTGRGDETQCYHCGGSLKDWELKDDPWEQHAKWFTKCYYVLMIKGQPSIDKVIRIRGAPITGEKMPQMNLLSLIEKVEGLLIEDDQEKKADEEDNVGVTSTQPDADDGRICKICYNEELGIVFLPCRHMFACVKCAQDMTACAVCRAEVTMTVHAIIS